MRCESAVDLVGPYLDGELDASLEAEVRAHIAACNACAGAHSRLLALRRGMRERAPYYTAPPGLEARIDEILRSNAREEQPWRWAAIAASVALAASLVWNAILWRQSTGAGPVAHEVVSSHIRSLIGTHLLDVPSSDRHTVKPWFNGKIDFSPEIKDFPEQGFPLAGGRIDYVRGRTVAVLVYHRRKHVINLFIWPSNDTGGDRRFAQNGFNVVHWVRDGMTYWAVSDVTAADLQGFVSLYRR